MEILTLGPVEVIGADGPVDVGGPKPRLVLALLALNQGEFVLRSELIDALWPDAPPPTAARTVDAYVSRIRQRLAANGAGENIVIDRAGAAYRLTAAAGVIDAQRFVALVAEASRSADAGAHDGARDAFERAFELWRGELPESVVDGARAATSSLEERRLQAIEAWAQHELAAGRPEAVVERLLVAIDRAPARERLRELLISARYRASGRGPALDAYRDAQTYFREELGLPPSAQLRALEAEILGAAGSAAPPTRAGASAHVQLRPGFPLPAQLERPRPPLLADRERELGALGAALDAVAAGSRQVVVLEGEAGIGKTELCAWLALRVRDRGGITLYGACDEEPVFAHQPLVEALRSFLAAGAIDVGPPVAQPDGELLRLLPEHRPPPRLRDYESVELATFRLYADAGAWLAALSASRLVAFVVEDLHWADAATIALLRALVLDPRLQRLLVVATSREPLPALVRTAGEAARRIRPRLLGLEGVEAVAAAKGHTTAGSAALLDATDGNPFFLVEVLRAAAEQPSGTADPPIPAAVAGVLGDRLSRLPTETRRALGAGAVLGRTFTSRTVGDVLGVADDGALAEVLAAAVQARILDEAPGDTGRYAFVHALSRETVLAELTGHRRATLHRAAGVSIASYPDDEQERASEIAHHFERAGSPADLQLAAEHHVRAARQVAGRHAHGLAAHHLARAVELCSAAECTVGSRRRLDLVTAQGVAERLAGAPRFRETLLEACELALAAGDHERAARAALANTRGMFSSSQGIDFRRATALMVLATAPNALPDLVLAESRALLAAELLTAHEWKFRRQLVDEALPVGLATDDRGAGVRILQRCFVALWGPDTVDERQSIIDEAVARADPESSDPLLDSMSHSLASSMAIEVGDLHAADLAIRRTEAFVRDLQIPHIAWQASSARAKRATVTGTPSEIERAARTALAIGEKSEQPDIRTWAATQQFVGHLLGGEFPDPRAPEVSASLVTETDPPDGRFTIGPTIPDLTEAMAIVGLTETGRLEEARPRFVELLHRRALPELRANHDYATAAIPALLALAGCRLTEVDAAGPISSMLTPYATRDIDTGANWMGTTAHYLGMLAALEGDRGAADAHFSRARTRYDMLGAASWAARLAEDATRGG